MNPNFKLDRPKVSDEEIEKHKDFDNLVKQFKEQSIQKARSDVNFLKNKKITYSAVIAGVVVICTVTYFTVFKNNPPKELTNDKIITTQQNQSSQTKSPKAFIAPPSKKMNVPYTSYKINATKGGEITHHTQSKIKIPAKAFVNKQGQDIVGDVEIKYREFHDQADIIASGIPMQYDSVGHQYHFESAGMFDIRGYQNGEQVFIKPDKPISVEMSSRQISDRYNQYVLDTIAKNWTYIKKDHPNGISEERLMTSASHNSENELNSPKLKELDKKIKSIPPKIDSVKVSYSKKIDALPKFSEPGKPAKASGKPQFELDVDYKDYPELAAFKNAVFEVGGENNNYNKELHQITWSSADISEGPQKGKNYWLTLKQGGRTEKLVVYPVLSGADYETALKQYEKKLADYQVALNKRLAHEKKLKEEMEAKQKAFIAEQKELEAAFLKEQIRVRQEMEKKLAEQFKTMGNQQRITRLFSVSNFGIYNSDCPSHLPKGASVKPMFVLEGNQNSVPTQLYMIEYGRNIVYNLYPETWTNISYDPEKEFSFCVLANGEMYVCDKEKFKQGLQNNGHFSFSKLPAEMSDVIDFRKALGI